MYLQKVEIKNIRSIDSFVMEFEAGKEAGWHVIIGDNGAGKTTALRAIALGVFRNDYPDDDFTKWVRESISENENASIVVCTDQPDATLAPRSESIITINKEEGLNTINGSKTQSNEVWMQNKSIGNILEREDIFVAYGSKRKIANGSEVADFIKQRDACISLFNGEKPIRNVLTWLKNIALDDMSKPEAEKLQPQILKYINNTNLLPNGLTVEPVTDSKGLKFRHTDGSLITFDDLSDGYQSALIIALDLIRAIFEAKVSVLRDETTNAIIAEGIVLIDEIDAHLHPTWQTRIGEWFTSNFPNIQFIVTTHSPLVCRGCVDASGKIVGSIFKLGVSANETNSGRISDDDARKLIWGDILDSYETNLFGEKITRGQAGRTQQLRYRELTYKKRYNIALSAEEQLEYQTLKTVFQTYVETGE